jgi:hypothetical protein
MCAASVAPPVDFTVNVPPFAGRVRGADFLSNRRQRLVWKTARGNVGYHGRGDREVQRSEAHAPLSIIWVVRRFDRECRTGGSPWLGIETVLPCSRNRRRRLDEPEEPGAQTDGCRFG